MSELASSTNHMACLLGTSKDMPHSSGLSLIDSGLSLKVKSMWPQPGMLPSKEEGCGTSLSPHAILDLC